MKANVVGIQKVEFTGKDGKEVKLTKYYVTHKKQNVDGEAVGHVTWNEINNGSPPGYKLKDKIEVAYNERGTLGFDLEEPASVF